jgi:hypothetical protein
MKNELVSYHGSASYPIYRWTEGKKDARDNGDADRNIQHLADYLQLVIGQKGEVR